MNSSRSIKSNTNLDGRTSPNPNAADRLSSVGQQPYGSRIQTPLKDINDDDLKFYAAVFKRCSEGEDKPLIPNREKLVQALNYAGYDLSKAKIDTIWSNEEIPWKEFKRILAGEKATNERALEEAFEVLYNKDRKSDWNAVDFDRFRTDMLEKGDRLTDEEFKKLRSMLGTENGKVDVKQLTKSIGETKKKCRQKILTEKKDEYERPPSPRANSPKLNNKNNVSVSIEPSTKKLDIPSKLRTLKMKGAFFCEQSDSPAGVLYYSIGYTFEIKRDTSIWITLEPHTSRYHKDSSFKQLDVRLLLFSKRPHSPERRLLHISSERSGTKSYLHLEELPKGSYEIVPVTFGGVLRVRSREVNERSPIKKLRETKNKNQFSMSSAYRDALEYIFDIFDFDDNHQLDRHEYNLWTLRTAGEEITDEDWLSVRQSVNLDTDENVSIGNFFKLNDFEVQDPDTTEQDLWNGLKSIGFNYALELDMMCQFHLTVHINEPDLRLKATSYVELDEIKEILMKFLQNKGEKIKLNNPSVQCYNYQDDCGSILFVENKGSSNARVSVQITNTKNATLTLPIDAHKPSVTSVKQGNSQIIWFAHKLNNQQIMALDAIVQVQ